ncbi:MAG: hypothetical protein LBE20_03760 [Deltaproteobacteria bacterium]|jgi:calcineurin-like phosphoesterase family protein|nr:hypothetical protein [Deltaproteobacteria bacterium]
MDSHRWLLFFLLIGLSYMKIDRVLLTNILNVLLNNDNLYMTITDLSAQLDIRSDEAIERLNGHLLILEDLGYAKRHETNKERIRLTYSGYEALPELGVHDIVYLN